MDKKPGCSVHVDIKVCDEKGQKISDFPSGGQYGYDRDTANIAAIAISAAVGEVIKGWAEIAKGKKAK